MGAEGLGIVTRLRRWAHAVDAASASDLMDEAAYEIERLRGDCEIARLRLNAAQCPYVMGGTTKYCTLTPLALTDAERESLRYYIGTGGPYVVDVTLAGLLSRTGSDDEKTGDDSAECHSQSEKTPERERLTDSEREAVAYFAAFCQSPREADANAAATLRGLLERMSPPAT